MFIYKHIFTLTYVRLISKCKLQIGYRNKLAIGLQLMENRFNMHHANFSSPLSNLYNNKVHRQLYQNKFFEIEYDNKSIFYFFIPLHLPLYL